MKPQSSFTAERRAAQHCAELLRTPPGPDDLIPLLDAAGEGLARALVPALAPLAGGKGLTVKARPARRTDLDELTMFSPALAAHLLLGLGPDGARLLAVLDAAAILRMVDRTFGGRGEAPSPLPDEFPGSADLMIARIEGLLVDRLGAALGLEGPAAPTPLARSGALQQLRPFSTTEPVAALELEVTEPAGDSWLLILALPLPTLAEAFGTAPRRAGRRPGAVGLADPLAEPFAALPLELAAVLVDMRLSMATVAALEPGTVLPVSVARAVPLRLRGETIATGTVGAADDRVALQITTAF